MTPIHDVLYRLLHDDAAFLVDIAMAMPGADARARGDVERVMTGFGRLLDDALTGAQDGGVRAIFFDTIVPALIGHGQTSRDAMLSAVRFAIVTSNALACRVEESRRSEATLWLSNFFANYVADLAEAYAREVAA